MKIILKDRKTFMIRKDKIDLKIILVEEPKKLKKDSNKHFFESTF